MDFPVNLEPEDLVFPVLHIQVPSLMYSHENIQSFNKQPQTKQTFSTFVFRGSFPSTNYPFIFIPSKELLFFIAVNYFCPASTFLNFAFGLFEL